MNIHRITYNPKTGSASLYFIGCNFRCLGCYWKQIYGKVDYGRLKLSGLSEVMACLRQVKPRNVTILSGEPRMCGEFRRLPAALRDEFSCHVRLLTNGFVLPDLDGVTHVSMSIKAVDDALHRRYTGRSNKDCLGHFQLVHRRGIGLSASTVYIPGLIEGAEIEAISQFVASVDPEIPLRVIGYMHVDCLPYREPSGGEVKAVASLAQKHLRHVFFSRSSGEDYTGIVDLFTNNLRR